MRVDKESFLAMGNILILSFMQTYSILLSTIWRIRQQIGSLMASFQTTKKRQDPSCRFLMLVEFAE